MPAHDERDFDFARKYGLEVRVVIQPDDMGPLDGETMIESVPAAGTMVNSGEFTGTPGYGNQAGYRLSGEDGGRKVRPTITCVTG